MGSYVNGVYIPINGETGWGEEINDFLTRSGEQWVNVKAAPYGAKGDGATDDTNAIRAAVTAANGVEVYLPPGTYMVQDGGILYSTPHVKIRGAGMFQTTIKKLNGSGHTPLLQPSAATQSVVVSDLTLDNNFANTTYGGTASIVAGGYGTGSWGPYRYRRIRFINTMSYAILLDRVQNVEIAECIFQGNGTERANSIGMNDAQDVWIHDNQFLFMYQGILVTIGGNRHIVIEGNYMDFGWWFTQAEYTNSGGTVTYSGTTLTDTAANFRTFTPYQVRARALTNVRAGSGGNVSYGAATLVDTGASFTSYGLARGDLVRTAAAFGVIAEVPTSATTLKVERWINRTTYEPELSVAAGTAYTVYRVATAMIESNTATVLTIYYGGWRRLNGTAATPSAGTLYEVGYNCIYPVQVAPGAGKDIRVLNNTIMRSFGDMLEMQADDYQVVGNHLYGGSDMGVACVGSRGLVVGNTIDFCGAAGIYAGATDSVIQGNRVTNSQWFNTVDANGVGDIMVENASARHTIVGNHLEHTMGFGADAGRWGLIVRADNPYQTLDHTITGNVAQGHNQSGYHLFAVGSGAGRLQFSDNIGTVKVTAPAKWTFTGSQARDINVKDYGAKGDGTTDDATAIAGAFTAVSSGGTVFFPPGTFICNSEIDVDGKSVHMRGAGPGATLIKRTANVHGFVFTNSTGTTVRDIAFETAFTTGHRSISVYIGTGCVGFTVDNCRFINQSATCIGMQGTGIKDVRITNNRASEVWEQFLDCVATDVSGLYVAGNSMHATTTNGDIPGIKPWFCVLEPTGTTGTIEHVRFIGNHIDFTGMAFGDLASSGGFAISKVATNGIFRNIVIANNTTRRIGTAVKVDALRWGSPTEGGGIVITGNNFETTFTNGVLLVPGFADSTYEDSVVITGNLFHGISEGSTGTYDGVQLGGYGAGGIVISDNVFKRHQGATGASSRYGVNIASANISKAIVNGNYIGNFATGAVNDAGSNNATFGNHRADSTFAMSARVIATGSLPAAATAMDGKIVIEDNGTGDRNLIVYAGGQRFRIDGGANV